MQLFSESAVYKLISCKHLAAKILRDKDQADHDPPQQIAKDNLQKAKISAIGNAGRADYGKSAGFRADNGKGNGPPGNIAVSQKIIAQRSLGLAEPESKKSNANEIYSNDGQVYNLQSH